MLEAAEVSTASEKEDDPLYRANGRGNETGSKDTGLSSPCTMK